MGSRCLPFVRSVWESFRANSGLEPRLVDGNRLNILHGGTLACMTDLGGSLAVASRGLFATGVSTDLSVTYLNSGGKIGDTVRAEVTCDKFGKTLAYTSIRFTNTQNELVARGSHTKFVALAWKDPQNITDELSPKPEKPASS
ncbi:hypothetical protein KC315_g3036 [Hortaea werneckii]|nr:hypothetical protein KC315_g3036 [Hortaea werneckii]KAI7541579.1 hypothetical protein KC331_g8483 [Hortaea werneckii]KAI7710151.1 hypothetical protein KC353_g9900 [Hortaea werneckii]